MMYSTSLCLSLALAVGLNVEAFVTNKSGPTTQSSSLLEKRSIAYKLDQQRQKGVLQSKELRTSGTFLQSSNYPVVIIGNDQQSTLEAAAGATLALATHMYRTGVITPESASVLAKQPVTFMLSSSESNTNPLNSISNEWKNFFQQALQFSPRSCSNGGGDDSTSNFMTDYIQILNDCTATEDEDGTSIILNSNKPMIHAIMEPGFDVRPFLDTNYRNSVSSLGLHVTMPPGEEIPKELSKEVGIMLQKFIDIFPNQEFNIIWDLSLHLSMLWSNSLPKSEAAHKNTFLVREYYTTNTILVKYMYDYQKLGGTDPLLSPTNEVVLRCPEPEIDSAASPDSYAQAAAYTALRGNGLDALQASCMAISIQGIIDETISNNNNLQPPSYDWSTINQIVQTSYQVHETMTVEPSNSSILRKKYQEYGYR